MKHLSRRSGFSLVELLTVIAIIAILAAIIFPVMGTVKERARQSQCMTNLHQIQLGMQMFKQDNRKYPDLLSAEVEPNVRFEDCKQDMYLFREYVKNYQLFHCPSSKVTNTMEYAEYSPTVVTPNLRKVYAYDSYSVHVRDMTKDGSGKYTNVEPHYMKEWVAEPADVGVYKPYPPGDPDSEAAQQRDYERQLKFKNPPGDTVITWCSYHEGPSFDGKALVIFLDGHADSFPAREVEESKWRMRQKKS